MNRKFTEYYHKEYEEIGDAAKLISNIKQDDNDVEKRLKEYEGQLYCPDCKNAKLSINLVKEYLYVSPKNQKNHSENCPMKYSKPGKKELKKYYDDLSDKEVQDKLDSAINMLLRRDIRKNNKDNSNKNEEESFDEFSFRNSKGRRKYIPKISLYSKSIDQWLSYSTLYYGECYVYQEFIEVKESPSEEVSNDKDDEFQSGDSNSLKKDGTLINNEALISLDINTKKYDTKTDKLDHNEADNSESKDYWLYHFLNKKNKKEILTMKITSRVKEFIKYEFGSSANTADIYNLAFIMELYKNEKVYNGTLWSSVYFKCVDSEEN